MLQRTKHYIVNSITASRVVLTGIIIGAAYLGQWWVVLICALAAFISDYFDGWAARRLKASSAFGMFFDPFADKVVCLTMLWLLVLHFTHYFWLITAIVITLYDVTTTVMRLALARQRPMPASRIAKYKTASLMTGLIIGILAVIAEHTAIGTPLLYTAALTIGFAAGICGISLANYLDALRGPRPTVVQKAEGVASIDFARWRTEQGITAVLFDMEGTLAPWKDDQVPATIVAVLIRAKKAGITHLGIVTNVSRRDEHRAQAVAAQIGATTYQLPSSRHQRKPNPYMIQRALHDFGTAPEQTALVGDKFVDVLAAKRAKLARVAWIKRLGQADHPADRFAYRPFESLLKRLIR